MNLARRKGVSLHESAILDLDAEYDKLADLVRRSVDMETIYEMAGLDSRSANIGTDISI